MRVIDLDELLKREEQAYRQVITQESKTPKALIMMTLIHEAIVEMLADSPIVEAEPVRHGRWIHMATDCFGKAFNCSLCGNVETTEDFETSPLDNDCYYCSRCGAKMDGKEE